MEICGIITIRIVSNWLQYPEIPEAITLSYDNINTGYTEFLIVG